MDDEQINPLLDPARQGRIRDSLIENLRPGRGNIGRIIGARPDGTMGPATDDNSAAKRGQASAQIIGVERGQALGPLQKTHDAINHIMQNETALRQQLEDANSLNERLEKECILLKRQLDAEHMARASLETTIRQIAEIVVNGSKAPGT